MLSTAKRPIERLAILLVFAGAPGATQTPDTLVRSGLFMFDGLSVN